MSDARIPATRASDSDDVMFALETARARLERGAADDAARWLRKAAVAAEAKGEAARSAELRDAANTLEGKFESLPDEEQVLSDIDDEDFTDETIVDDAPQLSAREPSVRTIATPPTPVARPPRPSKSIPIHGAIRVSVRRALGGRLEARPLGEDEAPGEGEEAALLVPMRAGAKLV